MLGADFKQFAIYADKVKVRAYVEAKGFSELLPQLYGVWESAEAIDFDSLPHKFALKPIMDVEIMFFVERKKNYPWKILVVLWISLFVSLLQLESLIIFILNQGSMQRN